MKNIVVIGGTSGIGKSTAELFLKSGDRVVISGTSEEKLHELSIEFEEYCRSEKLYLRKVDITNYKSVLSLKEFVVGNLAGCDVLINSAGIFKDGLLHEMSEKDYDLQFKVNVKGVYYTCKAFIPLMLEKQYGSIVNVASLSGIGGDYNASLYSASKAALINLTRGMALDYAKENIRINAVSPSATETAMFMGGSTQSIIENYINAIPNNRLGKPEDVAEVIAFLASDSSKHVTGQNIAVDGGLSAWSRQPRQIKEY